MNDAAEFPEPLPDELAGEPVRPEDSLEVVPDAESPVEEERTYPSTIGGMAYIVLLVITVVALVVVVVGDWRTGIRIFAGVLVTGAVARVALKERDAGMLAVRSKPVDAFMLTLVGGVLAFLASSIPDQPV